MSSERKELEGTTTPLRGIRRTAARHMVRAWEAPAFALTVTVDMTRILARKLPGITVTDQLVHAVARTLQKHPGVNAWFSDDGITTFQQCNIGIAVATDAGLVVPVVHDAAVLDLAGVAAFRKELVSRARENRLGMRDVTGGTFTISNLGMQGIDRFTAIVNVPQVAILAVGATADRFVRRGNAGVWLPMAEFTVTFDHRAVDGAAGAAFLSGLREVLEAD